MRRLAPMFMGMAGGMSLLGLLSGLVPLMLVPLLLLAPVLLIQNRRSRAVEIAWSGSGPARPSVDVAGPLIPAGGRRRGQRGSVASSLARVESRELVSSPWFGVGLGLWAVVIIVFGIVGARDIDRGWWEFFGLATLMCHPFVGMAVIAAHRNRTRSSRDGCDELFDTCPADADARTLGHLGTAWIAAAVCVVGVLALAVMIAVRNTRTYGPIDHEALASVLACAVLGAGGVALGVTLGRWARFGLVPLLAVVAVGVLSGLINKIGSEAWATDRLLATFVASPGIDAIFLTRPVWARLAWLAALTVLVAALGLIGRTGSSRVVLVVAGAGGFAIVAALGVVRPAPASDAERLADLVADPVANSICRRIPGGSRVCAYRDYRELADRTAAALQPVALAIPEARSPKTLMLTRFDKDPDQLQEEVRDRLEGRSVTGPDGALRLRFFAHPENLLAARLRFASHAVGLPTEAGPGGVGTVVAGEARGVLVLWLAAQGMAAGDARGFLADGQGQDSTDQGNVWSAGCRGETSVLQWSPTDLVAARALIDLPRSRVKRLLASGWDRFTDPATSTDELLVALGLAALGPHEPIEPRRYAC